MKELNELRQELDTIDRDIVRLFEQRMAVSRDVARYKLAHDMQVLDSSREEQVLSSRAALVKDPALTKYIRPLFTQIMALSRDAQEQIIQEANRP